MRLSAADTAAFGSCVGLSGARPFPVAAGSRVRSCAVVATALPPSSLGRRDAAQYEADRGASADTKLSRRGYVTGRVAPPEEAPEPAAPPAPSASAAPAADAPVDAPVDDASPDESAEAPAADAAGDAAEGQDS